MLSVRLKSARKRKKLTQDELAKLVSTTKSTISNYENGHSTPSNDMLILLANALDTSTDFLLGRNSNQFSSSKEELEFEEFLNDPRISKLYSEYKESSEERRDALLAAWEYLKSLEKK